MVPLPPISAGGGQSGSSLATYGSLYHASGDGDWVVNLGGSNSSGFGGFGSASSGVLGSVAGGISPLLLIGAAVVAWLLLKK